MAGRLCEHSGDWRAKLVTHPERTVAVGMERRVRDQAEKQPIQAWRKLFKALRVTDDEFVRG